ncbi:MAG: hypothetical protein BLM47_02820 [Candidatus Reconcilbacillus cellulovorans]|uniref:AB hydrolase-1 domain-containing protein n=1 Tax=Candidatus Reconcilbacillus cellulovorans TaxID=1906605 RepID=A0A2A6E351_9BACL|nr:MAG: hypothetical protein BLM47_02820 [Candidatus Reconcilbacillus cellulovorans]
MKTSVTAVFPRSVAASASRRLAGKLPALASGLALAVCAPVLAFHGYIAWTIARPTPTPLQSNPEQALGLPYRDVRFRSLGGDVRLSGWYIPAPDSERTVVFSHGYGANREEYWVPMYDLVGEVHRRGYNVLMFDYGYVGNPGRPVTAGVNETRELLGAVAFARSQGADRVYVWGFSMGAGIALQAALAGSVAGAPGIDALVLDSTFVLTPETLRYNLSRHGRLPDWSAPLVESWFPLLHGVRLSDIPFRDLLTVQFDIPVYVVHGALDDKAPVAIAEQIAANQSANPLSGSWIVPDGHHELLFRYHREEYLKRTLGFLDVVSSVS